METRWILGVAVAIALLAVAGRAWLGPVLTRRWRGWREVRRRALFEDALKHILSRKHQGRGASPESLGGALGLPQRRVLDLIMRMETAGFVTSHGGMLHLSEAGERWALQVVRAHRLWETYLRVEAKMPLARLHQAAERAEHSLTAERLDELDATLGHPARDPHGDPIPSASGDVKPLEATPLTDWPVGLAGQVVHIEDEPASVFQKIPSEALRPGVAVRVLERGPDHIRISNGEREFDLPPAVAANVHLTSVGDGGPSEGLVPLSELQVGEEAEMVAIDSAIQGFSRRRLLDLGLTPGARIRPRLDNVFGDPRAFSVRGTTIALRTEQASKIWVRRPLEQRVDAR